MIERTRELYKEIDEQLGDAFGLMELFGIEPIKRELRYFAADVIADCYEGRYRKGLTCACQCFLDSRLVHAAADGIQSGHVLIGDYFIGKIADFELPEDAGHILELFAACVEEEAGSMNMETFDRARYETLFRNAATEMKE